MEEKIRLFHKSVYSVNPLYSYSSKIKVTIMIWSEIRQAYHNQWLIIEAIEAHTTPDSQRHLDKIAVVEICSTGNDAMQKYRRLHQQYPAREFYFVNTGRETLDIRERQWLGIRG